MALGGGFEMCLSTDFRVMADDAKVGLPEVKLGIFPGFGGSASERLIGADNAIEWICAGGEKKSAAALKDGAVDSAVPTAKLLMQPKQSLRRSMRVRLITRRVVKKRQASQTEPHGKHDGVRDG